MINVILNEELRSFEADIRDLIMAFYPYKEFCFIYNKQNNINDLMDSENKYINLTNINLQSGSRKEKRNILKLEIYNLLKNLTHRELFWGTLTGIRPVNIVTEEAMHKLFPHKNVLLKKDYKKIKEYLQKEYIVSNDKAELLIETAKTENKILNTNKIKNYKNAYSVYIGVPFCKSTCLYCSFTSYNISKYEKEVDLYLDALESEFKKEQNNFPKKKELLTIYVGGGTPTSLSEIQFERLLKIIDTYLVKKHGTKNNKKTFVEYTIEAGRPDTITKEKLLLMKKYKVNRISINPQTFNQKTLDLIGRKHTIEDIIEKYNLARELKFKNINMDLIIGLPTENPWDILHSCLEVAKLKPDSITVHSLALKRAARLNVEKENWMKDLAGLKENLNDINYMMALVSYTAKELGMKPYYLYRQKNMAGNLENVGYSKSGKESIYNIMMMGEKHSVFGFGCNASTKLVEYKANNEKIVKRIDGHKSVLEYIKKWHD